jgi:hypothetical protein
MKVIANIRIKYNNERYDKGSVINMKKDIAEKFIEKGYVDDCNNLSNDVEDIDDLDDKIVCDEEDECPTGDDEEE